MKGCGAAALTVAVLLASLAGACGEHEPAPPAYVRLDAPAPRLENVPAARALLVVFWATWCPPCVAETPQLRALAENPPEHLSVVVYGHDQDISAVRDFFGGDPPPALHFRLDGGEAVARGFGVDKLPASFLVVDGHRMARFSGPRDWSSPAMRRLLRKLIRERLDAPERGQRAVH
jgi:cytochrome c biogenesis protein CcmG, thiol:disulfide interchange protein DsbE